MISLDTETTGLDLYHGAKPFLVTVHDGEATTFWEWDVDPETREPRIPVADLCQIQDRLGRTQPVVLQNAKFDMAALQTIGWEFKDEDWSRVHDTLIAGHLLASNQPHNLTDMVVHWLGVDIEPFEKRLKEAVTECRRFVRSKAFGNGKANLFGRGEWRIAGPAPDMPSAGASAWKADGWLPRALASHLGHAPDHPWWTALSDYANADSEATFALWGAMRAELERRGLTAIYRERMKLLPIALGMERRGVTLSMERLRTRREEYAAMSDEAGERCVAIAAAAGCDLQLPRSGNNGSLTRCCFEVLRLPVVEVTEKGAPSLNKAAMARYEKTLAPGSPQAEFIASIKTKRRADTALAYMEGYERFGLPLGDVERWMVLHPSLNPTGTDTLRWSSSNPNEQNISKQEGFNLRWCFGPAPGREWWSLDAKNLELRIPAYEAGEAELVHVFDHPDDPPYHGSYHLVVFDLLHPALFTEHGKEVKTRFEATEYQWVKNGNFAVIYGAQDETADETYHFDGAREMVFRRFPRIAELAARMMLLAERNGFVETIPDLAVDPQRGYPLLCTRTANGGVMPTVPLNYHVSGTAMQWTNSAMVAVAPQLAEWTRADPRGYFLTMQVHDELVFDFPAGRGPEPWRTNLPKVRAVQRLMESCGDRIGVPTPVDVEYHAETWDRGKKL